MSEQIGVVASSEPNVVASPEPDVRASFDGSVGMVTPISESASEWVKENVGVESWQWLGDSFSVDHRYLDNLLSGMEGDGLIVERA